MTLRVLIVDDEALARARLARLLEPLADVEVVAECESGEEALSLLAEEPVDVLLLDISMPGLTGLEIKALLGDDAPYVIFATAHPEHALEAFDLGAVDYVLKPIAADRLKKALDRARQVRGRSPTAPAAPPSRLAVAARGVVRLVDPATITHAEHDGALVTIFLKDGEKLLTDQTLSDLERRLPEDRFERVHRRAIVNLSLLDQLEPLPNGGYVGRTVAGEPVPISRKAARRLRRRLGLS